MQICVPEIFDMKGAIAAESSSIFIFLQILRLWLIFFPPFSYVQILIICASEKMSEWASGQMIMLSESYKNSLLTVHGVQSSYVFCVL